MDCRVIAICFKSYGPVAPFRFSAVCRGQRLYALTASKGGYQPVPALYVFGCAWIVWYAWRAQGRQQSARYLLCPSVSILWQLTQTSCHILPACQGEQPLSPCVRRWRQAQHWPQSKPNSLIMMAESKQVEPKNLHVWFRISIHNHK